MSDIIDDASDREEFNRGLALRVRKPTLKAMGACYYCGCDVNTDMYFCDSERREGYEMQIKQKAIAGL